MSDQPSPATAAAKTVAAPGGTGIGHYSKIEFEPSVEDPRRLRFVAIAGAGTAPPEVIALRRGYEALARVVTLTFADDLATRQRLFLQIHRAADRGLRGADFNLVDGQANLEEVRTDVTDAAHAVRDQRLWIYSQWALGIGVPCILIGFTILLTKGFGILPEQPPAVLIWATAAFLVPAGAAIGVWGEFALRMTGPMTFDGLLSIDPARWRAAQRVSLTIGVAFIFAFLLYFNAVQVGVGGLLLNDFGDKTPALGLAVGAIVGLAFPAVREIIIRLRPAEKS